MLVSILKNRSLRAFLVISLAAMIAIAVFGFSSSRKASALPSHEVTHYYYDGPDYANEVGVTYVTCYGIERYGQETQYVFTIDGDYCY